MTTLSRVIFCHLDWSPFLSFSFSCLCFAFLFFLDPHDISWNKCHFLTSVEQVYDITYSDQFPRGSASKWCTGGKMSDKGSEGSRCVGGRNQGGELSWRSSPAWPKGALWSMSFPTELGTLWGRRAGVCYPSHLSRSGGSRGGDWERNWWIGSFPGQEVPNWPRDIPPAYTPSNKGTRINWMRPQQQPLQAPSKWVVVTIPGLS